MIDFTKGWKKHLNSPGAFHLEYMDGITNASIVTGPKGSGLMASNDPVKGIILYEAWFDGMEDPIGYLTLEEIQGIIKYIHARKQEEHICKEIEDNED